MLQEVEEEVASNKDKKSSNDSDNQNEDGGIINDILTQTHGKSF